MDLKQNFNFIKDLKWKQVFGLWHNNEKNNQAWVNLFHERGFDNWHDWRMTYATPLMLDKLNWGFYSISQPLDVVPNFYGGPFTVWKKYYYGDKDSMQYKDLIDNRVLKRIDGKVIELSENFPKETNLIGLIVNEKIVIIEGTHRCLAIALLSKEKRFLNSRINIALAKSRLDRLPIVGGTK